MDGMMPVGYPGYSAAPREQKSQMIAGTCSTFLPGLGQVYNGEAAKGFALFIMTIVGLAIFVIPGVIVWFYALYNAYTTAGKMNTGEIPFRETRMLHLILFIVFAIAVVAIALVIIYVMFISPLMSQFGSLDMSNLGNMGNTGNSEDVNRLINNAGI
jgi:TM2 domain-containing membrane protein YozV